MITFAAATWNDINELRERSVGREPASVEEAAQTFAESFNDTFETVVLCRVFIVISFSRLPDPEQAYLNGQLPHEERLRAHTPVLVLLGTAGRAAPWSNRLLSEGHRAIPLLDVAYVSGIPMLAKLLADLQVDFSGLDDGRPIVTRKLLGSNNNAFFVDDARTSVDAQGRHIIPSREFVEGYGVRTVFGMGGSYADGTLLTAIVFTNELIDRLSVGRFPSLIGTLKMATAPASVERAAVCRASRGAEPVSKMQGPRATRARGPLVEPIRVMS